MLGKTKCLLRSMAFNLFLNDVVLLERTISEGVPNRDNSIEKK